MISDYVASILSHTSDNGRFVTDEKRVLEIAEAGLLFDHGPQALAGGAHYLTTTMAGRQALSEWRAAQPKPPKPKRRPQTRQFEAWRSYCEAFRRVPFGEFLREIWPSQERYFL